jgi:1,4-alpha-glucan branching enzyme
VPRYDYHLGLPGEADRRTRWVEVLNTDAGMFGGSNLGNLGGLEAQPVSSHGRPVSAYLTLPPLAALFLKPAT